MCEAVPELWGGACLALLHASMALARSSTVADVCDALGFSAGGGGRRLSAASDVVQWVTAVCAHSVYDGAQSAAACLQALAWEAAAPHIPGGITLPQSQAMNRASWHPEGEGEVPKISKDDRDAGRYVPSFYAMGRRNPPLGFLRHPECITGPRGYVTFVILRLPHRCPIGQAPTLVLYVSASRSAGTADTW